MSSNGIADGDPAGIVTVCNWRQAQTARHCYRHQIDPMLHEFIKEHRAEIVNRSVEKGGGHLPQTCSITACSSIN
jgi:hypothetical protein